MRDTQFAKFSDRTISNNIASKRFSYAWLVSAPHCVPSHGFSARHDLAEKSAKRSASKILARMDRLEERCQGILKQENEQRKNWANRKLSRVAEVKSGLRIEIVEVTEPSSSEIINHLVFG